MCWLWVKPLYVSKSGEKNFFFFIGYYSFLVWYVKDFCWLLVGFEHWDFRRRNHFRLDMAKTNQIDRNKGSDVSICLSNRKCVHLISKLTEIVVTAEAAASTPTSMGMWIFCESVCAQFYAYIACVSTFIYYVCWTADECNKILMLVSDVWEHCKLFLPRPAPIFISNEPLEFLSNMWLLVCWSECDMQMKWDTKAFIIINGKKKMFVYYAGHIREFFSATQKKIPIIVF